MVRKNLAHDMENTPSTSLSGTEEIYQYPPCLYIKWPIVGVVKKKLNIEVSKKNFNPLTSRSQKTLTLPIFSHNPTSIKWLFLDMGYKYFVQSLFMEWMLFRHTILTLKERWQLCVRPTYRSWMVFSLPVLQLFSNWSPVNIPLLDIAISSPLNLISV